MQMLANLPVNERTQRSDDDDEEEIDCDPTANFYLRYSKSLTVASSRKNYSMHHLHYSQCPLTLQLVSQFVVLANK
jgi:hypothetical protein